MSPWQPAVRQYGDPSTNNPSLGQELSSFLKLLLPRKAGTNRKQLLRDVMTFTEASQSEVQTTVDFSGLPYLKY